jgi:exoribonuclease-2
VELAKRYDDTLPDAPSSLALSEFLRRRRAADPNSFADISLSVVKLLGGESTPSSVRGSRMARKGISVSPSTTTRTRPRRIVASPISLCSVS